MSGPATPADPTPFVQRMVQEQLKKIQGERPDLNAAGVTIGTPSWLDPRDYLARLAFAAAKRQGKETEAITQGSRITINPEALAKSKPEDVGDTLVHELTHIKQHPTFAGSFVSSLLNRLQGVPSEYPTPGTDPSTWSADELEGFQAEADRRLQQHRRPTLGVGPTGDQVDIELPSSRRKR